MNLTIFLLIVPLALIGHVALWVSLWNHVQGTSMPQWMNRSLSDLFKFNCGILPILIVCGLLSFGLQSIVGLAIVTYAFITSLIAAVGVPSAFIRRRNRVIKTKMRRSTSRVEKISSWRDESLQGAGFRNRLFLSLPFNQAVEIEENIKEIEIPRLHGKLDGLSIAHLSDLHFTGQIGRSFFDRAIELINEMDADIVAITGDIIDKPEYLNWLPGTIGKLKSRYGVYAILGNHDCKNNLSTLRLMLSEIGVQCISGRRDHINIRGQHIVLAGNELPWIPPAADMEDCPARDNIEQLRILLAHTPDQIDWARFYDFDLMLAGHTHGGQFRLPLYGPVVCPSRLPLDYASGTIFEEPTVLHVSRGLSAEVPLRLNCRPEITKLVLRCPVENRQKHSESSEQPREIQKTESQPVLVAEPFPASSTLTTAQN